MTLTERALGVLLVLWSDEMARAASPATGLCLREQAKLDAACWRNRAIAIWAHRGAREAKRLAERVVH